MRTSVLLLLALLCSAAPASAARTARGDSARVTVTYVVGDAVYLSAGRLAGVADSAIGYILDKRDTVVVLKVVATSSKSSVSAVVRSKRAPVVGDVVRLPLVATVEPPAPAAAAPADSSATPSAPARVKTVETPAPVALHGRVNAQYFLTRQSGPGLDMKRPGLVVSLKGTLRDAPVQFEFHGNLRSLSYGSGTIFGTGSVNQSRIYSLFVRYDDGATRVAAGRLTQAPVGGAGAVDGILVAERLGDLTLGLSAGFEPSPAQRSVGSDLRKATLYASYALTGSVPGSATVAYTRRYYRSYLDRDVASAALSYFPSADWSVSANGDVDLHRKEGGSLAPKADITNAYAITRYRVSGSFTAGAGVSAWRPTYLFSQVASVPDSMLDYTLRTSPSVDLSLSLPSGTTLFNTFSARSTAEGFGKEYSDYLTINQANLLESGVSARLSALFNATLYAKTKGAGLSLQRTVANLVDATVRYQWYRHDYSRWAGTSTTHTAGVDLLVFAGSGVSVWTSAERLMGDDLNTTSLSVDIGWRF